jgi:hypothetical protein
VLTASKRDLLKVSSFIHRSRLTSSLPGNRLLRLGRLSRLLSRSLEIHTATLCTRPTNNTRQIGRGRFRSLSMYVPIVHVDFHVICTRRRRWIMSESSSVVTTYCKGNEGQGMAEYGSTGRWLASEPGSGSRRPGDVSV